MRAATVPQVRALACPNCGGTVQLRSHGRAVNAVCSQCFSVVDARDPGLKIIQRFEGKQAFAPLIALGSRGVPKGTNLEAIGCQVREIRVSGVAYRWAEYLLYNPWAGYRYLTEYQGHWNLVRTLPSVPASTTARNRKAVVFGGQTYRHFQTARAKTIFVLGEFPWQVRVGDEADVEDYVAPPQMLSSERTGSEVTWSQGIYVGREEIEKAFSPAAKLPGSQGTFSNQPSPWSGRVRSSWTTALLLTGMLLLLAAGLTVATRGRPVFAQRYMFDTQAKGEASFVTPVFEIDERTNVEVSIDTDLSNDWAYFSMALISDDTGNAFDFGREVSYYFGRDSDGSWSEGGRKERSVIPAVPPGRYYLRIEPEMDDGGLHRVNYQVAVKSGAMNGYWFPLALGLLLVPPIWTTWRSVQFEQARWAESDYGSVYGSSTSSDDEDD